jgi:hypothetical protein
MATIPQRQFDGCAQKSFFEAHQIRNSTAKQGRTLLPLSCEKLCRTSAEKVGLLENLLMSVVFKWWPSLARLCRNLIL